MKIHCQAKSTTYYKQLLGTSVIYFITGRLKYGILFSEEVISLLIFIGASEVYYFAHFIQLIEQTGRSKTYKESKILYTLSFIKIQFYNFFLSFPATKPYFGAQKLQYVTFLTLISHYFRTQGQAEYSIWILVSLGKNSRKVCIQKHNQHHALTVRNLNLIFYL